MPFNKLLSLPNPSSSGTSTPSPVYVKDEAISTSISVPASDPIPFKCFAFVVNNALIHMSDVSNIPEDTWPIILNPPLPPNSDSTSSPPRYHTFVVDVLRPPPFVSHFGLDQAVSAARRIGAAKNYMLGFGHEMTHDQWVTVGEGLGDGGGAIHETAETVVREALDLVTPGPPVWIRPAFDGLRLVIPEEGDADNVGADGYSS